MPDGAGVGVAVGEPEGAGEVLATGAAVGEGVRSGEGDGEGSSLALAWIRAGRMKGEAPEGNGAVACCCAATSAAERPPVGMGGMWLAAVGQAVRVQTRAPSGSRRRNRLRVITPMYPNKSVDAGHDNPPMGNTAVIKGRNLSSGWPLEARLDYVDATLTDRTPATPLNPWLFQDTRLQVNAARVQLNEQGLARALSDKLSNPRVYLKPGNRIGATGIATLKGIPVPVALDFKLERVDAHTVRLSPLGLTKIFQQPVTIDLRTYMEGDLRELSTGKGTLTATVGGPAPAERPTPSWFDLSCQGDFDAGGGVLHDAKAEVKGAATLPLTDWQHQGSAHLISGQAELPPSLLAQQIHAAEPYFRIGKITLEGSTYHVQGTYLKLSTRFDLKFGRTPDGQLRLDPGDVRVLGIRAGKLDELKQLSFLKPDGNGFLVDLKAAAGLDMPKIGPLGSRNGCLVLRNP